MVENCSFHLLKPLGAGFPSGYSSVNVLQQHVSKEKNNIGCLPQV
jgi:hypothetical protein